MAIDLLSIEEGYQLETDWGTSLRSVIIEAIKREKFDRSVTLGPGLHEVTPESWPNSFLHYFVCVQLDGTAEFGVVPKSELEKTIEEATPTVTPVHVLPEEGLYAAVIGAMPASSRIGIFQILLHVGPDGLVRF